MSLKILKYNLYFNRSPGVLNENILKYLNELNYFLFSKLICRTNLYGDNGSTSLFAVVVDDALDYGAAQLLISQVLNYDGWTMEALVYPVHPTCKGR